MPRVERILGLSLILSLAGTGLAGYLSYEHLFASSQCGAETCQRVLSSQYSEIGGISLASLGLGYFLALSYGIWMSLGSKAQGISNNLLYLSVTGVLPLPLLFFLQGYIIQSWCIYCLSLAGIIIAIFLTLLSIRHSLLSRSLSIHNICVLLIIVIITPLTLKSLKTGLSRTYSVVNEANPVVATIGTRAIHLDEIVRATQLDVYVFDQELRQEWLDQEILETAAAEAGLSLNDYVSEYVYALVEITEEEISNRIEFLGLEMPDGRSAQMLRDSIRDEIGENKAQEALKLHIEQLKSQYEFAYYPPASEQFIIDPNVRDGPELGPSEAPVTLVVFSDFDCSHCAHAHEFLMNISENYRADVRLIFKHFPEFTGPSGLEKSKIAAAAHLQGYFWDIADILYEKANKGPVDLADLASIQGLDVEIIEQSLNIDRVIQQIEADLTEGRELGITATPSIFINGKYIGTPTPDRITERINQELSFLD